MAIDSVKLINFAARGVQPGQIAAALGVTPSYLTQILADEKIKKLVEDRQAEMAAAEVDAIVDIESIKGTLLTNIKDLAGDTDSLNEAVRAYETLDKIQRVKEGMGGQTAEDGINIIVQQVPIFVQQNLAINVNKLNEIISVDERSMVAMPTVQVHKLISKKPPKVIIGDSNETEAREEPEDANYSQSRNHAKKAAAAMDF